MAPLFALLLAAGCGTEPTDDLRNGAVRIEAAPSQIFLQLDETKTVDVTAVDSQGNRISTAYEVTSTGPGITVVRDSSYLPVFVDDSTLGAPPEAPTFRFRVTATGYGASSFTVSAEGRDVTVPVQVVAQNTIEAEISDTAPALNEVVTITAPPGITFSPTTTVTLADTTAVQPAAVTVAPDGKSLTFLPPPNATGAQLVISDVVSDGAPGVPFSPSTAARITTPRLTVFDGTVSNLAPAANEAITITLNGTTFDPFTATFAVGATPATLIGATANTATVIPAPGSTGLLFINGAVIDTLPQFLLTLSNAETDTLTVGPAGTAAGTDDPSTAPSLAVPDSGFSAPFFDTADFVASPDRFYKLVVTAAGDYTISLGFGTGSDIDLFLCPAPGAIDGSCDFQAALSNNPEVGVYTLTPGTY
ncbi:MAG: hypothetical protein H0T86_04810, partial [Gemmatimonadales bacterium]|nr:hypothetical protein [Gemmatimonadales bacterium]